MKKTIFASLILLSLSTLSACQTAEKVDASDIIEPATLLETIDASELSSEEEMSLIQMRQEEMLARDVYLVLYEKWGQNTFQNIAKSEQTHMDAVKYLLDKYDIMDPIDENQPGMYSSPELQKVYWDLVSQWEKSLEEALKVGATVEDLDIKDLQDFLEVVDNEDIILAYQNLMKWSRNHLRAFVRQIERQGATYEVQFISQADYQEIIWNSSENFMVDSNGKENNNSNRRQRRGR